MPNPHTVAVELHFPLDDRYLQDKEVVRVQLMLDFARQGVREMGDLVWRVPAQYKGSEEAGKRDEE
jgi:hypothetical protein